MKVKVALLIVCVSLLVTCGAAWAFGPIAPPVATTVRDGEGRIWAVEQQGGLCWWDVTLHNWRGVFLSGDLLVDGQPGMMPSMAPMFGGMPGGTPQAPYKAISATRGAKGAITCLWFADKDQPMVVTLHLGAESKVLARVPSEGMMSTMQFMPYPMGLTAPLCYMDSKNNVWLNHIPRELNKLTPDGEVKKVYDLPLSIIKMLKDQMPDVNSLPPGAPISAQLGAMEDSRGRIIFYSQGIFTSPCMVTGLIICDGDDFTHIPSLPGLLEIEQPAVPGQGAAAPTGIFKLIPRDEKTAWLRPIGGPLAILNLDTFEVAPAPEPEPGAFQSVRSLDKFGDILLLGNDSGCWINDGVEWRHPVSNPLGLPDMMYPMSFNPNTMALDEGDIIIAAGVAGLGYLPAGETTFRFYGWRRGFPLTFVSDVLLIQAGQVLVTGQGGTLQVDLASLSSIPLDNPLPVCFFVRGMAQTTDGRIWAIRVDERSQWDGMLSEWDGKEWKPCEVPINRDNAWQVTMKRDSRDRIWVGMTLRADDSNPVAIFDTVSASWKQFPTYIAAVEATKDEMRGYIFDNAPCHPEPRYTGESYMNIASGETCYSGDGRIWIWGDGKSRLFDGAAWLDLPMDKNLFGEGSPCGVFFTDDGKTAVAVRIQGRQGPEYGTWVLTSSNAWEKAPDVAPQWPIAALRSLRPVQGSPFGRDVDAAVDNFGVWWSFNREGILRRYAGGVESDAFPPGFANPFVQTNRRQLGSVYGDSAGHTFIMTGWEAFLVPPRGPLPDTALIQTTTTPGYVEFTASSTTPDVTYSWRVDEEPWTASTNDSTFKANALPEGKHRVQARAMTATLEFDRTPAGIDFEVGVTDADIAAWVTALGGAPFAEREEAARLLRANPEKSLPALKAALGSAGDDAKWWINGVLEGIREDAAGKAR